MRANRKLFSGQENPRTVALERPLGSRGRDRKCGSGKGEGVLKGGGRRRQGKRVEWER